MNEQATEASLKTWNPWSSTTFLIKRLTHCGTNILDVCLLPVGSPFELYMKISETNSLDLRVLINKLYRKSCRSMYRSLLRHSSRPLCEAQQNRYSPLVSVIAVLKRIAGTVVVLSIGPSNDSIHGLIDSVYPRQLCSIRMDLLIRVKKKFKDIVAEIKLQKRKPFSILNFKPFLTQSLLPCQFERCPPPERFTLWMKKCSKYNNSF